MKRRNPESAYAWVADVRAYTDRITQGPVQEHDLAGQQHIGFSGDMRPVDRVDAPVPGSY